METVFERCGGMDGIHDVVVEFYDLVLASPTLGRYFEGIDMEGLLDHQTKFIAWVMEGPVHYSDEALLRAHAHLGIARAEFLEIIGLMRTAMERNYVAPSDIDHVIRALMRREPLIVVEAQGEAKSSA